MAVKAVVFDLYGTILDIDSMRTHVAAAGIENADAFVAYWRRKQLEYAFLTTIAGAYRDFDSLTLASLMHACEQYGHDIDPHQLAHLTGAWGTMPAYSDVAPALQSLATHGFPLAVLTNGTPVSANAALDAAGVRHLLADVLSVEAVQAYKPDPRVYALATERFRCEPAEIAFVSSNGWDAWGALEFGFRVAWCNRAGNAKEWLGSTGVTETTAQRISITVPTMAVLSGLHELDRFVSGSAGTIP
jgi:2-haloacid dehalogenase